MREPGVFECMALDCLEHLGATRDDGGSDDEEYKGQEMSEACPWYTKGTLALQESKLVRWGRSDAHWEAMNAALGQRGLQLQADGSWFPHRRPAANGEYDGRRQQPSTRENRDWVRGGHTEDARVIRAGSKSRCRNSNMMSEELKKGRSRGTGGGRRPRRRARCVRGCSPFLRQMQQEKELRGAMDECDMRWMHGPSGT